VVAQSDIDGTTTWAASYQADGRRTAEAGTNVERHRANTKEEDPTGLLNEGFRYRDMETGTFISRDPLGHVDGPNVYCYVRQNPWTKIDPEGLWGIGDSNGPVLDYLWDLGGGVVDGGIEAVEGIGHAVAHPINTATAVKDGVLAVKDGIGELSSALDAGHVTWGEIGTAYGDGLAEVASDPAKVGKIVGSSAVSLGAGKAAAVGGKLAMAAAVQTNTARTIAVSAVLASTELAPVASGAARGGAIAAQVGTGFAKGAAAANSGKGLGFQNLEYKHFRSQGFSPDQARYLMEPYPASGMGHHFIGRQYSRSRGGWVPDGVVNSSLNIMGRGMSRGRFYERHFLGDPYFHGTAFPRSIGGTWSGSAAGLVKPSSPINLWYASPNWLRNTGVGAAGAGAAWGTYELFDDD
jgi:RHS repeat-associated protein